MAHISAWPDRDGNYRIGWLGSSGSMHGGSGFIGRRINPHFGHRSPSNSVLQHKHLSAQLSDAPTIQWLT